MRRILPYRFLTVSSASGSIGVRKRPCRLVRLALLASDSRFDHQIVRSRIGSPMIGRSPTGRSAAPVSTTVAGGVSAGGLGERPRTVRPRPPSAMARRRIAAGATGAGAATRRRAPWIGGRRPAIVAIGPFRTAAR